MMGCCGECSCELTAPESELIEKFGTEVICFNCANARLIPIDAVLEQLEASLLTAQSRLRLFKARWLS